MTGSRDGYRGREAPAGNLRRFFSCSRFQSPEGGGYRETDNLRVGVGAHDDPGESAYRERNTSSTAPGVPRNE